MEGQVRASASQTGGSTDTGYLTQTQTGHTRTPLRKQAGAEVCTEPHQNGRSEDLSIWSKEMKPLGTIAKCRQLTCLKTMEQAELGGCR
ncbi:hypothetical protein LB507_011144 [Fusarium sp. FIESC RH6]|nr:hypothetical protein LB507_011144 [Fusarium sp. FIESC RH6]